MTRQEPTPEDIDLEGQGFNQRLAEANAIRRAPGFAEEAHRQSAAVAGSPEEAEVQEWVDAIRAWPEEDES